MRPALACCALPLALFIACKRSADDDTSTPPDDTDTHGDDTDTHGDDTSPPEFPDDPSPFTISVTGAMQEQLVFDSPTCYQRLGSTQLRVFWRNGQGQHVFFLLAELMSGFEGPGTYDATNTSPDGKLQEEAGGYGRYFYTDPAQGDEVSITVVGAEEDRLWGSFTISGMHDPHGAAIQLSPMPVPIWCPVLN